MVWIMSCLPVHSRNLLISLCWVYRQVLRSLHQALQGWTPKRTSAAQSQFLGLERELE